MFFRELDFSLEEIRGIMQNPAYEKETALQNQKALLLQKRDRLDRLIALVDKTLKGERDMSFKQFDTTKIEEAKQQYAAEVKQRWGNTVAYAEYEKKSASYNILMPVSTATAKMLYRNLLYTAISRARKEVILVGSREAVNPQCSASRTRASPSSSPEPICCVSGAAREAAIPRGAGSAKVALM